MEEHGVLRILGWVVAVVIMLAATALAFVWFVVPDTAKDEFRVAHGLKEGMPERHFVPEGFQGWAVVKYDIPEKPELPVANGVLVFNYPDSGILETQSGWNPGLKRKEYFSYGPEGPDAIPKLGPDCRIWNEYELSHVIDEDGVAGRSDRQSGFFVGTQEEYKKAELVAPHFLPGTTVPDIQQF